MSNETCRWTPTTDILEISRRLHRLLPITVPPTADLESRIRRIGSRYDIFKRTAPAPLWVPGLVVTNEIHRQVELYLPFSEIQAALAAAFRKAWAPSPFQTAPFAASSWYGFLADLSLDDCPADPSVLLRRFIDDYDFRIKFLFTLFLPRHFGGAFGRYPLQMRLAEDYLLSLPKDGRAIHCLDAACGTGEQAWELARALSDAELPFQIEATSIDQLEVFAASHAFFPHDPARNERYRRVVSPIIDRGLGAIYFSVENLLDPLPTATEYDLILCNGFLGGPFLHDSAGVYRVVRTLAGRLRTGGLLLAADRFHDGWKKIFPSEKLRQTFMEAGLLLVETVEGVAGERVADAAGSGIVRSSKTLMTPPEIYDDSFFKH